MYFAGERADKIMRLEQRPTKIEGLQRDEKMLYNTQRQINVEHGRANFDMANQNKAIQLLQDQSERLVDKQMLKGN